MSIPEFLVALAAKQDGNPWTLTPNGGLRCGGKCPLTYLAGDGFETFEWRPAAAALGLSPTDAQLITDASDNQFWRNRDVPYKTVRDALLTATGATVQPL